MSATESLPTSSVSLAPSCGTSTSGTLTPVSPPPSVVDISKSDGDTVALPLPTDRLVSPVDQQQVAARHVMRVHDPQKDEWSPPLRCTARVMVPAHIDILLRVHLARKVARLILFILCPFSLCSSSFYFLFLVFFLLSFPLFSHFDFSVFLSVSFMCFFSPFVLMFLPALTRCGLPQQCPPGFGVFQNSQALRAAQESGTAQQCRRVATEVREVLELFRLDDGRVRSLWQQDRVAGIRKSFRKRSVDTSGSTLSSIPQSSDELRSRDDGDGSYLDLIVDWSKPVGATGSVLECDESGRDVDLNLGNSVRGGFSGSL